MAFRETWLLNKTASLKISVISYSLEKRFIQKWEHLERHVVTQINQILERH